MSTPLARFESARASGRVTWLSILGIILVPLVVAGVLVWAFWNPQDRLEQVNGAIVNNDSPVELDGQTVPLGRQLAAGLVGGDETSDVNYSWVLTDEEDAADGLSSGEFAAVVTIPENFSAAATSFSGEASAAEKATIDVTTSDKSRLVDDAVSQVITTTAAGLVGNELTTSYLENIYVGFNSLGDQLGTAADGATELGEGANTLADGAVSLADGTTELAAGTSELSTGASGLATGVTSYVGGVSQLSGGLGDLDRSTSALPTQVQGLATGAAGISTGVDGLIGTVGAQSELLAEVAEGCDPLVDSYCLAVLQYLQAAQEANAANPNAAAQLSAGAKSVASGAQSLADGIPALTGGISQLAGAASTLSTAGTELSSGATQLSGGVSSLSTGAASLADGATGLSDGVTEVAGGVNSLADGLTEAVAAIPSYTGPERQNLAEVVAEPVVTDGEDALSLGAAGVPFYAALALWLGAFGSLIVLRAKPARSLGSTRPSILLALRTWAPAAGVGALQGVLVAGILQPLLDLEVGAWIGFAALAALTGIAFSAANQALNAVFGGAGRFVAMIVALVLIATSIIATVPAALDAAMTFLPVQPAVNAFHSVVTSGGGLSAAIVGLLLWTAGSLMATTMAIAKSRTVTVRQLVPRTA